jgi:prepilin-type N-terminal cleavage/methylation domain-containing protein
LLFGLGQQPGRGLNEQLQARRRCSGDAVELHRLAISDGPQLAADCRGGQGFRVKRVAATWRNGCALGAHGSRTNQRAGRVEEGFTLIELIVVVAVMPILVGALSIGLVSILSLQSGVSGRLADSGDAQVVSVNFGNDVQSSVNLTTAATAQCGSGQQLLGLEWNPGVAIGNFQTVVSYVLMPNASGLTSSLIRQYCTAGSSTPTSSITMSSDVPNNQPAATIAPPASNTAAMSGWTPTVGVTSVTFPITGSATTYRYSEVAVPGESANSTFGIVTPPPTTCGFATLGTGTYASSLCFVDFSQYNPAQAAAPVCQPISQGIINTPFTMTFCLSVSGVPVAPASIPTYTNPPTSEAFLGNNGFYTGIPGNPALYQKALGTSTVTLTNINVLDANGKPATGWEIVTGDAESTDKSESMTWTSDKVLHLIPNSSASPIGNACAAPDSPDGLTGVDTTNVECAATVSSDKTGTVMLKAAAPTTLTVQMVGNGLEAMFIGLLLPGAAPS